MHYVSCLLNVINLQLLFMVHTQRFIDGVSSPLLLLLCVQMEYNLHYHEIGQNVILEQKVKKNREFGKHDMFANFCSFILF
jgi:hypothetical protein